MNQEQIVDNIILDMLEVKKPGSKQKILDRTTKSSRRLAMLSILDDDRQLFNDYKKIVLNEPPQECGEYSTDIVELLRKYVRVADIEKKEHGEVMTPTLLVNEMLDKLPSEVWSNKDLKWLDPCNGVGTFPSVVVERLMVGLKDVIVGDCDRYRHIIENMIYVCEIQPKNMFLFHCAFDREDDHELNTYFGSFLTKEFNEHMLNVWGIEKFDIVMGNPPYQDNDSDGDNKLYLSFTNKSITFLVDGGYLLFITPKSILDYLTNVNKNRTYIDKFYDIIYLSIDCPSKYFNVGSTFVYFLLCKEPHSKKTTINYLDENNKENTIETKLIEGMMIPSKPSKIDLDIINKITSITDTFGFDFMRKINGGAMVRYRNTTKSLKYNSKTLSDNQDDIFRFPLIHKINKTNPYPGLICYCSEELKDIYKPKVLISRTGYLMPSFDAGGLGITDNMNYINVETQTEATNIIFLLESPIRKYLGIQFSKSARDGITTTIYNLKKIDVKKLKSINNELIYSLYNLSQEEIKHLEKTIKK